MWWTGCCGRWTRLRPGARTQRITLPWPRCCRSRATWTSRPPASWPALAGQVSLARGGDVQAEPDFLIFHRATAGVPWHSQALWIYTQFIRWGFLAASAEHAQQAAAVFRPDVYRRALGGGGIRPATAGPDAAPQTLSGFFDGRVFDPQQIGQYLASFEAETG